MALPDADPRSLADLWAPDFGPPPADMPESIRWMHGRMWCPDPRPPRTMPDGTSECEWVDVPTPRDQLNQIPPDDLVGTLFAFNLGVEMGQLAVLAAAWLRAWLIGRRIPYGRVLAAYALGIPAAVWTLERAQAWWA